MANKRGIRGELLDELLKEGRTQEALFGPGGLMKQLTAALVERVLQAELAEHLDKEKAEGLSNRRNGTSSKTLHTENGTAAIEVGRDRHATFEPQILPKYSTRVNGIDEKILAFYSRGLSTRDIQSELASLYGTEVSPSLISRVTDAVQEEVTTWQNRPLEKVYAVVWLDALRVKMREEGVVKNRAVHR